MPSPERLLLTGALVFDGLSDELHAWDVLIENGEIEEVGPDLDAVAERIDASGKWVTPGFIDMHVHVGPRGHEVLPVLLGNGITTVRDVGGNAARLKQIVLDIANGKVVGPRIIYSGPLLHGHPARSEDEDRGEAPGARPFRTSAEAREAVDRLITEEGVGSLKIYETVRDEIGAAILEAAAGRVPVTAHLGRASSVFLMEHGIGGLEHLHSSLIRDLAPPHKRLDPEGWQAVPGYTVSVMEAWAEVDIDGPEVERWLKVFLDQECFLTPTVTVYTAWPRPDDSRLTLVPSALEAARQSSAPTGDLDVRAQLGEEITSRVRENQRAMMALIHQHHADLVVGTDFMPGKLPGWSHHAEMEAFQRRGIKPIDILKATTSVSAKHLWRSDLGQIAPGRRADLVILDADPTQDITNVSRITEVLKDGVVYESPKLLETAEPDTRKFAPTGRI